MKKRCRVPIAALCTLALVAMPVLPAWGTDASSGAMTAKNQTYQSVGNGKQRIDSFTLDDLYSYQSLGNDQGKPTLTLSTSALQKAVKEKLLPQWSGVAASVFRDQAGQLVDLYGYQPNGGCMSQAGFDAYFNMNNGPKDYKDETWSTYSIESKLRQTNSSHAGSLGNDQLTVTGVRQVDNLDQARKMMGQALRDCESSNAVSADEFLNASEAGETRLEGLEGGSTGFANIVTAVNCKGSSANFDYVSFGIVFYDFESVPVAANNLTYVVDQKAGAPVEEPNGNPSSTEVTNGQQQDIVHTAKLGNNVTETVTTTISALASANMSQNMGASIGCSETETTEESTIGPNDDGGLSGESSSSSSSFSMGVNWGAAWGMAGAAGAQLGHSKSEEISKAVETTIAIPPHAVASIENAASKTTYNQAYQQPVVLSYKVAIFAMSGDYYSSKAFGGIGGINTDSYDKQSFVIKFDTKDETTPFFGCVATDDLYSRVVTNKDVRGYDSSGHTYTSHSTAKGFNKSEDIDWNSVMNNAQRYYGVNVINGAATKNFFYETPASLSFEKSKTTSNVDSIKPLYNLASVTTPKTEFTLYSRNTLDLKSLSLAGYNRHDVPFYGFKSDWGEWKQCDKDGTNPRAIPTYENKGDSPVFLDKSEKLTTNADSVITDTNNTIYLTWVPKSTATSITEESSGGQNLRQDYDNGKIKTPVVTIVAKNIGLDNPTVTATGSYTGYFGTPINLNDVKTISCVVRDSSGKKVDTRVKWECDEFEREGYMLSEDTGYMVFTKPGTYHVRPYVIDNNNNKVCPAKMENGEWPWIEINATEHNMTHYEAKNPTDCTDGDKSGWIEHYRCSNKNCEGKYYADANATTELAESDVIKPSLGHNWGDWTVVQEASANKPVVEERVCKNNPDHKESREISTYTVNFDLNGKGGTAPESQVFRSDTKASVVAPAEPKAAGWNFEGWYTDPSCTEDYIFGKTVTGDLTLYAKWSEVNYTVATTAAVTVAGSDSYLPASDCSVVISADDQEYRDSDGYYYRYNEAQYSHPVTVRVVPPAGDKYSFADTTNAIQAIRVNSDLSTGEPIELTRTDTNTYTFDMPASDVAVVASLSQAKVTVTYDKNLPEGTPDNATLEMIGSAPQDATLGNSLNAVTSEINNGDMLTLPEYTPDTYPLLSWSAAPSGSITSYAFGGWYADSACTQPFLSGSKITRDTTLYAKWTQGAEGANARTVKYTLHDIDGTTTYDFSYKAEDGSAAYDPTKDLYAYAGADLLKQYNLQEAANGSHWYTSAACTDETAYDFTASSVTDDLELHAQVVPKTYTVTYFDGEEQLGDEQKVEYGQKIDQADAPAAEKQGCTLDHWVTADDATWNFATDTVKKDQALYAAWTIDVTFDTNGHGATPSTQTLASGDKVTKPATDPTAEGYTFGGWFTDQACTKEYDFNASVTDSMTLYAKWTAEKRTVTFNANGHGTAPAAQTVDYGSKAVKPADPTADGYSFGGWYKEAACTTAYDFATPVTADLTLYAKWTEKATPAPEPEAEGVSMFRLYNPNSGEHFYTASGVERDVLVSVGWSYEGVGWTAPESSGTPVYRLYNPNAGDHHYTTSIAEKDMLVSVGWNYECIGWYSDDAQGVPLYREYNPNAIAGAHNYTKSWGEHEYLVSLGWHDEGIGWYGLAD